RASVMKHYVDVLRRGEDLRFAEVLAGVSPDSLAQIESATRIDWLDAERNFELTRGLTRVMGIPAGERFFHRMYAEVFDGPVFSALMRGIKAMGAKNPGSFLKHGARGYAMVFRGVGHIEISHRDEHSILFDFHDLPRECFEPELSWVRYSASTYLSAFDLTDTPGEFQ